MSAFNIKQSLMAIATYESLLDELKGEVTAELEEMMNGVDLAGNVDQARFVLHRMRGLAELTKDDGMLLLKKAKAMNDQADKMEDGIIKVMQDAGRPVLEGDESTMSVVANKGLTIIDDEDAAKSVYGREVTTVVIDKKAIREDLDKGIDIECAHIQPTFRLKFSANKKIKKEIAK